MSLILKIAVEATRVDWKPRYCLLTADL